MNPVRLFAVFAIVGGTLQILAPVWYSLADRENTVAAVSGGTADLLSMAFILIGLVAVYSSQEQKKSNWTVSFIAAFLGTALFMSSKWLHAFVEPALMQAAPSLLQAEPPPPVGEAMFFSFILFALGWVYFGASSLRAKALPAGASILLLAGPLLDFVPFVGILAPAVWGAGIVWLGMAVLRVNTKTDFQPIPEPGLTEIPAGGK